jgi:hypothetical protein
VRAATRATAELGPASSALVWSAATVASAASPTEAPMVRLEFSSPEARPASLRGTPEVPAIASGVTDSPKPRPVRIVGPSRPPVKLLPGVMRVSQASPAAASVAPATSRVRGPERVTSREVTCAPTAMVSVCGRNA